MCKILFNQNKKTLKISVNYERGADNHTYNAKPPTLIINKCLNLGLTRDIFKIVNYNWYITGSNSAKKSPLVAKFISCNVQNAFQIEKKNENKIYVY